MVLEEAEPMQQAYMYRRTDQNNRDKKAITKQQMQMRATPDERPLSIPVLLYA